MSYPGQPNYCPPPPPYGGNPGYCPPPPQFGGNPGYCPPPPPTVIMQATGNCPSCRMGFLSSHVTCLGVFCAIVLFPIGLICLFAMQEQRCSHCGFCS
ncbi:unnamed protein product [Adineta steineri]|uniref:Membrane protein BRI3 n=1 Tax=Adineta steineri TaxID=433720 RepID=A0A813TSF9_9BILA|nr:unnamed protein product [Adineta steineri]CAF1074240.1 unnamed protein product [Adineta steineri]CAF1074959.1 unnamed protein product [Adineta steineri]CAF1298630.1 unnamed protein product [Adineta steineri]CAF1511210.1 unnamed protein product [Adineta steineri]